MAPLTVLMLVTASAAVLTDLSSDRIPNILPVSALVTSFFIRAAIPFIDFLTAGGPAPSPEIFMSFLGGAAVPLLLFPVFRLRMIGAGDIKLLMALGSCLTPSGSLTLVFLSFLAGGLIAVVRILCFPERRQIRFAVPVFSAVLILTGGSYLCGS